MKSSYEYIGKSFPIQDAALKVSGKQQYLDDMYFKDMLYARILFSPIAHAEIKSIDVTKAEALPGVIKVFHYWNSCHTPFNNYAFFIDQNVPKDEYIFNNKVRFVGDRIAAVVAVDAKTAEEAVKLIEVVYEELPALVEMQQALDVDSAPIHEGGNLLRESVLKLGDAEKAIEEAQWVVDDTVITPKVHHAAMETHVCVAQYDPLGSMTIWTPCQSVFGIRTVVADLLGLSYNKLRVIKTAVGGSFGAKQHAILEPIAAYLAKETKSTVKLRYNRTECILGTVTRTAVQTKLSTAVAADGKVLGTKVTALVDAGAYVGNSLDLSMAMGKKYFRTYRIPNLNYNTKVVYTNTPIAGGCRGWGGPQECTAMELHFDHIARELDMDPAEFRLKNLVYPYDKDELSNLSLGNARIRECLEKGLEVFGWNDKKTGDRGTGRFRRGIGLACGGHVNGFYGKSQDLASMTLKMNEDGSFNLNTGVHDQGCGTVVNMAQIAAEVLEVDPGRITVLEADTERSPYDMGTFASRVTYVAGKCAYKVACKVREMIIEEAAAILEKPKDTMECQGGYVWAVGDETNKLSYRQIATHAQIKHQIEIIASETHSSQSNPGAYAAHFAEVVVDTETGMVKVSDYLAVHDVGRVLNAIMVEGQVIGAVQMGIGFALCEELKYDSKGKPLNSSFAKYTLINVPDMPTVRTVFLEYGGDDGPFEAKSIGEIATIPVGAAIANAINDALGTSIHQLPLTPERIIAAIRA